MKRTIQVPIEGITADLRNGIPDEGLIKKHGFSETGLKRLFDKLLRDMSNGSRQIQVESAGMMPPMT